MSWQQTIKQGMELIIKGCNENGTWSNCHLCPFYCACDAIMDMYGKYVGMEEILTEELENKE